MITCRLSDKICEIGVGTILCPRENLKAEAVLRYLSSTSPSTFCRAFRNFALAM